MTQAKRESKNMWKVRNDRPEIGVAEIDVKSKNKNNNWLFHLQRWQAEDELPQEHKDGAKSCRTTSAGLRHSYNKKHASAYPVNYVDATS